MNIKHTRLDRIILAFNNIFLYLAVLIVLVPLIYIVIASFMDPIELSNRGICSTTFKTNHFRITVIRLRWSAENTG